MVQRDQVPEEVMDRELWLLHVNALEDALLGRDTEFHGHLSQSDYAFLNDVSLAANSETHIELRAPGGDSINGQMVSSGQFSGSVEWVDDAGELVRREGIFSNRAGGEWANFRLDSKGPFVNIVITNDTISEQTISIMGHYK